MGAGFLTTSTHSQPSRLTHLSNWQQQNQPTPNPRENFPALNLDRVLEVGDSSRRRRDKCQFRYARQNLIDLQRELPRATARNCHTDTQVSSNAL